MNKTLILKKFTIQFDFFQRFKLVTQIKKGLNATVKDKIIFRCIRFRVLKIKSFMQRKFLKRRKFWLALN